MFSNRLIIRAVPAKLLLAAFPLLLALPGARAQNAAASTSTPPTPGQLLAHLDPDMREVVLVYDAIRGTPETGLTPQDARQQFAPEDAAKIIARVTGAAKSQMPVGKVIDGLTIPGRDGNQIPIRIYVPAGSGPFPAVVYYHGGGFVIATIDTYDSSPRALTDYAHAIFVSVEYRKSPEYPFPAALHDAIDAYKWVTANIGRYNGIESQVAVAGESAGGNLATEVAIAARDEGLQRPTHQLLVYPVTSGNLDQPSDLLYTAGFLPLNTAALKYDIMQYGPAVARQRSPGGADSG